MKVRYADKIYKVVDTKNEFGVQWYRIEDEPNHYDWVNDVDEVFDDENEHDEVVFA